MKIRRVDAELIQKDGLMDRQTDRGGYRQAHLRVALLNFADATQNKITIHFF